MEPEIELSPEDPQKESKYYFSEETEYSDKAGCSNIESDLAWITSSHHVSDDMDLIDEMIKADNCSAQDYDCESGLVCAQSSLEQSAYFRNANFASTSYYNPSPKKEYESPNNNESLKLTCSPMNVKTEHVDWLESITESTALDSATVSGEVSSVEYPGTFSGYDHINSGTDSGIPTCYPDFSDMCSESYSFWEFLPVHNNSQNEFSRSEGSENSAYANIQTPSQTSNYNSCSTPSSGYYSCYFEEDPRNENTGTDTNIMVPYYSEPFSKNTDVSSSSFFVQNEEAALQEAENRRVSANDYSHLLASTITQSSYVQQNTSDDCVTTVTPHHPLIISGKTTIAEKPKNICEESKKSPVCVLKSVYSLHSNSDLSFEQYSGTYDGNKESTGNNSNSTEGAALQNRELEISKSTSVEDIPSLSSTLNEPVKTDKHQQVLLLLKERIPRSSLNNKDYSSAKLLVQTHRSRSLATQNVSIVSKSASWNISNKRDGISRSELPKSQDFFQDYRTTESGKSSSCKYSLGNSADGSRFHASCSVNVNPNQNVNPSTKQFVVWAPSQTSVAPISSPQISVFAISPVQQHLTIRSKGLTENNGETLLSRTTTASSVSIHTNKTILPSSICNNSPIQPYSSAQSKNLTENKDEALVCPTAKSSSMVPRNKGTVPKFYRVLNSPPPYITVVKKSVVNSSKKQRQKTVRELLEEKKRKLMLDSLARQTIKNSGQLNSPVKFVTPLNEVSNNRTADSKRRPVVQSSTYAFSCDKLECGKHFVRILPAPVMENENRPLTSKQKTKSTLFSVSPNTSEMPARPTVSCSVLNSVAAVPMLAKQPTEGETAVLKEKSQDTLPPFKIGRVNAKEHRPRHYDIMYLQIGNFYVGGQESPSGRIMSKFKIIFTKRHFTYEFPVPDSCLTYDSPQSVACIVVTFESVTAMQCDNNMVKIQVNCQPVTYLGSHQPRFGVISSANVFDTSKPVDITSGEIMKCRVHEMQLRGHQADTVKKYLCNFDKRFKVITQRSIRPSATGDLRLLPSAYVCADPLAFKKSRKKGVSGYVRNPPWPFEVLDVPSQVCACRISCRSVRCSCVKAGQKCSQGRSICLCSNCDNPLNVLHSVGVESEMAVLDSCLFHNIYQVPHLRQFLTREVILSCCQSIRTIKDCIPGVITCPNSACAESIQYSWCSNSCYVIRDNPPKHCSVCGKCRFNGMRHCEECNKCYSTIGNSQCPKCKPE